MLIRIVSILLLTTNYSLAQVETARHKSEYPAEVTELFQYLTAAYEGEPTILVPFIQNSKFGLMDYRTLNVVVPAIAPSLPLINTADKSGRINFYYTDGTSYEFSKSQVGNQRITSFGQPQVLETPPPGNWVIPASLGVWVLPADHPFKGFTYERNNEGRLQLTSYTEVYKDQSTYGSPYYPHLTLFEINNEVFAIAQNQEYQVGIIDTTRNPITGFDFNYQRIIPIRGTKESLGTWFLAMKNDSHENKFHFVNAQGEIIPESVLPALDYSINFFSTQASSPYHEPVSTLGYAINSRKVIDLYELKLVNFIPAAYKTIYLNAVSTSPRHIDELEEQRKNTLIFAVVEDENGNQFFMDFDGKKYIPEH